MKSLIITYALTYGGAAMSLVQPWYGFLIYVTFGLLKPESLWFYAVPQGNYSRIVAIGFLIGWVIHGCGDWRFGRGGLLLGCLMTYWGFMIFSAATAPDADLGWTAVEQMGKVFVPVLAGATLIDSVGRIKQLAWVIVICQGYLAYEFNLAYYYNPMFDHRDFNHGGLDNNGIAITMVTAIGMAFFLGMHAVAKWQRLVALGCAALMAHVVLFSNSRGGMLSLILTGGGAFLLLPKRPAHLLVFALAVAGVLFLAGEGVQKRFMSSFSSKEEGGDEGGGRKEFWLGCLSSMRDHPLGVGPYHWVKVAPSYGLPARAAHSTWFQIGAELGIPGLTCLLGCYLLTMRRLYPLLKDRTPVPDPWMRYAARMVITALVGFIFSAQFVTVDGIELPYYVVLVGIGVLKMYSAYQAEAAAYPPRAAYLAPEAP